MENRRNCAQGWCGFLVAVAAWLSAACGETPAPFEEVAKSQQTLAAETRRLTIVLPSGAGFDAVALAATDGVTLRDRARVENAAGEPRRISNSGTTATVLQYDSVAGTTTSAAPVSMWDRATVIGDVVSSGLISRGTNTVVTGNVSPNVPLVFDPYSFSVSLPASGSNVTVQTDGFRSVTPGSYANVLVSPRATLSLVAGNYFFDSLTVEPSAFFSVDTRNGPVNVYLRTGFVYRGIPVFNGPNDRLFIAYLGTTAPAIEKSPDATIVAPFAAVRLGIGGSPYNGAYYAKSLDLDPDVVLKHRPFSGWTQFPFEVVPIFQCVERRAGGAYVGHYGYRNPGGANVTIPLGANNRFSPGLENRRQPTTFLPGTQPNQFAVTWVTHPASWFLNGIEAAPDTTKSCPQNVGLLPIADATVNQLSPSANFGTTATLAVSATERALIQFDRAAVVRELGPARLIRSAKLELTLTSATPNGSLEAVAIRPRFGEQTATWNCARDTNLGSKVEFCHPFDHWALLPTGARWESPFEPGAASPGTQQGGKVVFDVTAAMQRFLGPERILALPGFLIRPTLRTKAAAVFESRERGAALAPRLVIEAHTFTDYDIVAAQNDAEAPFDVIVDTTVVPKKPPHPSMTAGGPTRAIAAVKGPDGRQTEFTDRELVVHTMDDAALTAVRTRLNATLLYSAPLALPGMPRAHLLRIDPSRTDPSIIVPTLLSRVPGFRGRQRISSDSGLRTLAALAAESSLGTRVGLNVLGSGAMATTDTLAREVLQDGVSTLVDDPNTPLDDGVTSRNPKDWPHFKLHDVVRAWKALIYSRRSFTHTTVAVHDGGFHSDHLDGIDLASPGCPTAGCTNLVWCTSGTSCPWHGTDSINAGFGEENNSIGAAGPGGPASDVTAHLGLSDPITFSSFVASGVLSGQRILSMSYGGAFEDWMLGLTIAGFAVYPPAAATAATLLAGYPMLEAETALARASGVLLFAAAGNKELEAPAARNVDARRCFVVKEPISDTIAGVFGAETPIKVETCPWEEALWWPCESAGVNCVEGSHFTDKTLHPSSNYGTEDVEYRAVFTSLVKGAGTDATAGDTFRFVSGTSTSTPFVAGIAALTWAGSNGAKSAGDIERCLLKDGKFVNAFASMRCGLDGPADFPPVVIIERPVHGSRIGGIGMIQSRAIAADVESGRINQINWFGNGAALSPFSSYGQTVSHFLNSTGFWTIEARASDSAGKVGSDIVTVNVGQIAPILSVINPAADGAVFYAGLPTDFIGKVNNRITPNCNSMTWSATQSGTTLFSGRTGCVQQATFTNPGTVVLTASYTDAQGTGTVTRTVNVVNDGKPHVKIRTPSLGADGVHRTVVEGWSPVPLAAAATPVTSTFTYYWQFEPLGGVPIPIGTPTASTSFVPPIAFPENCDPQWGYVSVTAVDAEGNMAEPDRVLVEFNPATCDPL